MGSEAWEAMSLESEYLESVLGQVRRMRTLAEGAIAQVTDDDLFRQIDPESNSIAVVMRHIAGNLRSRFTDFLISDGEKPDRDRDGEFEIPPGTTRETIVADWDGGFSCLETALGGLKPMDLLRDVHIRGERMTAVDALNRALMHVSLHVGQIVMVAKHLRGSGWRTLSIPRGQSRQFAGRKRV